MKNYNKKGFTILEILLALTIVSLIISFVSLNLNETNKIKNEAKNKLLLLESIILNANFIAKSNLQKVILCPTIDFINCVKDWNNNLMIFIDNNNDEKANNLSDIKKKYFVNDIKRYGYLVWYGFSSDKYIYFKPYGILNVMNGKFVFYDKDNKFISGMYVSKTGRIRPINIIKID